MKPDTAVVGGTAATHAGVFPATVVIAGGRAPMTVEFVAPAMSR